MTLTAIDPGKKQLAWAHFELNVFQSAGLSRFPLKALTWDTGIADYAFYHGTQVPPADMVVVEGMYHYPPGPENKLSRKAQIAVANDLLQLQAIGCLVAGNVGKRWDVRTASEWKGQVDKDVTKRRAGRELDLLELTRAQACLAKVPPSLQHNVWDAIALGLTYLGRVKK